MVERREYRSALRQRQAGETRARIVGAAAELFSELGYARTTFAKIATRAEVSPETVQNHGPKAALLRAAIEVAGFGAEGVESSGDVPAGRALYDVPRAALPSAIGAYLLELHSTTAGLTDAMVGGAANDPVLREYYADVVASIRRQWRDVFGVLVERGWLRPDLQVEQASDGWCVVAGPEAYLRLVRDYGWTGGDYADWLARNLRELLD